MRKYSLSLLVSVAFCAGAVLFCTPDLARAEVSGPYLTGGAMGTLPRDSELTGANAGTLDLKLGFGVLGAAGYQFSNGIRMEGELAWRRNGADRFAGAVTAGSFNSMAAMANLIWEYDNDAGVYPYLGGGLGAARLKMNDVTVGAQTINDSDLSMAWQAIAGVAFALDPNLSLIGEYRYFSSLDGDFQNSAGGNVNADYANHSAMLALRYRFGAAPVRTVMAEPKARIVAEPVRRVVRTEPPRRLAPPKPVVQTQPAPLPAAQAKAAVQLRRSYVVFFDTDSAALTPEARSTVAEASLRARNEGTAVIEIAGHADRAGPAPYNLRLSRRRAENTAVEIRNNGVTSETRITAFGETEPLVPTADGIAEPRNRRVEIVLQGQGDGLTPATPAASDRISSN